LSGRLAFQEGKTGAAWRRPVAHYHEAAQPSPSPFMPRIAWAPPCGVVGRTSPWIQFWSP